MTDGRILGHEAVGTVTAAVGERGLAGTQPDREDDVVQLHAIGFADVVDRGVAHGNVQALGRADHVEHTDEVLEDALERHVDARCIDHSVLHLGDAHGSGVRAGGTRSLRCLHGSAQGLHGPRD